MERWDILSEEKEIVGVCDKGHLPEGRFHRIVHLWTVSEGKFLLTKRAQGKHHGGLWETTGGSVRSGESPSEAARREAEEETGLHPLCLRFLWERAYGDAFVSVFATEYTGEKPRLREGETTAYRFASPDELRALNERGECMPFTYEEELFALLCPTI
ncbi:MAG: NUDIX domain-containing protein [Christensenellaceae bacterium]